MTKTIMVKRKLDSGFQDAGAIYNLVFSNFCEKTDLFAGCIVFKLDNGESWNFKTLTQYFYQSLNEVLEQEELELYEEADKNE